MIFCFILDKDKINSKNKYIVNVNESQHCEYGSVSAGGVRYVIRCTSHVFTESIVEFFEKVR